MPVKPFWGKNSVVYFVKMSLPQDFPTRTGDLGTESLTVKQSTWRGIALTTACNAE